MTDSVRERKRRWSVWTAEDDAELRRSASTPVGVVARKLGKTVGSVQKRRERLGIAERHRTWTDDDRRFLCSQSLEWSWPRLAEHFAVSERAVREASLRAGVLAEDARFELTAVQVAELCGVHEKSVRRWIARGELTAWRTTPNAPKRVPPRHLRAFLIAERRGVLQLVPEELVALLARDRVEVNEEVDLAECAALARAREYEVQRWVDRRWLLAQGTAKPIRTKDFRAFAINMPEIVPALRRVPVQTVQLLADLWG